MRKILRLALLGIIPLMTACAGNGAMSVNDYCQLPEIQREAVRANLIALGVLRADSLSICPEAQGNE